MDAYKFITTSRRPLAQRAEDIGAWTGILQAITYLSVAFNGLTIALSSDFVPHMVYQYYFNTRDYNANSPNKPNTLQGFVNFSLTTFYTKDWGNDSSSDDWLGPQSWKDSNATLFETCQFKAYREDSPDYNLSGTWFHIIAARLAFVLVFEHLVFGLTGLIAVMIPDVPNNVKVQIQRENLLAREILFENQHQEQKNNRKDSITAKSFTNPTDMDLKPDATPTIRHRPMSHKSTVDEIDSL